MFELITMNETIRREVMKGVSAAELKSAAMSEGMMSMHRDGMLKVRDGLTTTSEIIRSVFTIL